MKRNVLGFAACGLIGLAAVFIYKGFNAPETKIDFSPGSTKDFIENITLSNQSAPFVRQAVFNARARTLYWELSAPTSGGTVRLHFFVRERDKTRYVFSVTGIESAAKSGKLWVDNSRAEEWSSGGNLYVIVDESAQSKRQSPDFEPAFDARKAAPVSVFRGN